MRVKDPKESLKWVLIMVVNILDIGSGNVKSIQNWIERLHVPIKIITKATEIDSKFLILPGVGSAGFYMQNLKKGGFDKAIKEHIYNNNSILGICLGFQIMGSFSEEDGGVEGLGILDGRVKKLEFSHTGWEKFQFKKQDLGEHKFNSKLKLTKKQNIDGRVFFNHEYGFISDSKDVFSKSISDDLKKYSSMVVKNNIIGMQFHPEKSQQTGLELLSMVL